MGTRGGARPSLPNLDSPTRRALVVPDGFATVGRRRASASARILQKRAAAATATTNSNFGGPFQLARSKKSTSGPAPGTSSASQLSLPIATLVAATANGAVVIPQAATTATPTNDCSSTNDSPTDGSIQHSSAPSLADSLSGRSRHRTTAAKMSIFFGRVSEPLLACFRFLLFFTRSD